MIRQVLILMLFFILCTAFTCEDPQQDNGISKLCGHKNVRSEDAKARTTVEACEGEQFVDEFFGLTGKIQFNPELEAFVVITNAEGTFDCQIVGVLCGDYGDLVGQTLEYSGQFFEYHGAYAPPVGGQKIFVIKGFEYGDSN